MDAFEVRLNEMSNELKAIKETLCSLTGGAVRGHSKSTEPEDEDVNEEKEDNELKQWMENEVKLPYYRLLRDHGFEDMESIRYITMDDLKEINVHKLGHRKKILREIAKLNMIKQSEVL